MGAASAGVAARYSVRPLLPGPDDALRDAVLRLGVAPEKLIVLAQRGAVEALALQGLAHGSDPRHGAARRAGRRRDAHQRRRRSRGRAHAAADRGLAARRSSPRGATARVRSAPRSRTCSMARGTPPPPLEISGPPPRLRRAHARDGNPQCHAGFVLRRRRRRRRRRCRATRACSLQEEGADIIDIGGESTRPSKTREEVSVGGRDGSRHPGDPRARGPADGPDQHRHAQGRRRGCGARSRRGHRQRRLGTARRPGHGRRRRCASGDRASS